jgi:cyclohexyl-isocyanide hydratase
MMENNGMIDRRLLLTGMSGAAALSPFLSMQALAAGHGSHAAYDWHEELSNVPGIKMMGNEQIAMLMYPDFTALDLVGPYHFFAGMMGATVHLVTNQSDLRPVKSDLGLAIQPTITMADCPKDLDILFAPGGTTGTIAAANDPATIAFMADRASRAGYITSVCTGALILGTIGALRGKRATSHWSVRNLLGQFGATPVDQRVVQDGNVVTGAGVSAGLDFGLALVSIMRGQPYAAASMLTAEYHPVPPFPGGTPETTPKSVRDPIAALFDDFVASAKALRAPE